MNLLRPITIDLAGDERNNDVFRHYKTLKWKISANQGEKFFQIMCLISEHKVGELIHHITHCYYFNKYYFNVKHH